MRVKPWWVRIRRFAVTCNDEVFYQCGLGSDGKVYVWDRGSGKWLLAVNEKD